jgi:6,7-dimethyl-8-ribityllumazine synthase
MKMVEGQLSAQGKKFLVIMSRFNDMISRQLLEGARDALLRHGAREEDIEVALVPGALEIPALARRAASSKKVHAIICLGTVIRGGTPHFEYVASESAKGVAQTAMSAPMPVINGIITTDNLEQAIERAGTKAGNKGFAAAMSAMEMASIYEQIG